MPAMLQRGLARCLELFTTLASGLSRDRRQKLAAVPRASAALEQIHAALTGIWPDPGLLLDPFGGRQTDWCQVPRFPRPQPLQNS